MRSIFRQSFCAAAHLFVQSGAWFIWSGGTETIVYVDNRNTGCARVEHGQERPHTAKACAITDAGRHRDDRAGKKARRHRRQDAIHAGDHNNHLGCLDRFAMSQQPVQP